MKARCVIVAVPIAGCGAAPAGGGFYAAYPTPGGVRVWRVGATGAPVVAGIDDGPAVAIAAAGDGRIWVLWTEGFGDPDVLAAFNIGTTTRAVTSYRRLGPGLTLNASPTRLRDGERTEVRFTVLDAGDPVSGARVTVAGRSGTTNSGGRVTLTLGASRSVEARATKSGYTAATRRIGGGG